MANGGLGTESAQGGGRNGAAKLAAAATGTANEHRPDKFFLGKEVTIYAPPGHMISLAYANVPTEATEDGDDAAAATPKGVGAFTCNLLYAEYDEAGEITNATISYFQGRRWRRVDTLNLKGCAISFIEERADYVAPTKKN